MLWTETELSASSNHSFKEQRAGKGDVDDGMIGTWVERKYTPTKRGPKKVNRSELIEYTQKYDIRIICLNHRTKKREVKKKKKREEKKKQAKHRHGVPNERSM